MFAPTIVLLLLALISAPCAAFDVNLSPADTNAEESGATPSPSGTINLATPHLGLRDVLSAIKANKAGVNGNLGNLNIILSPGVYRLTAPLTLSPDPSWWNTLITIEGTPGGAAVISGGKPLTGFAPVRDLSVLARLPAAARSNVLVASLAQNGITDTGTFQRHGYDIPVTPAPLELFYLGQPMTVARWPNSGFATISTLPGGPGGLSFTVTGGNPAAWQAEPNLRAMGYWARDWADTTLPVQSVSGSGQITLAAPAPEMGLAVGQRVLIENALSELDQAGEYYVDQTNKLVYFWPPAALNDGDVEVSVVNTLFTASTAPNLTITNLTLTTARGDGLQLIGGGNIVVDHVDIRNMGDRGAVSNASSSGFRFVTVENTGEGGLVVTSGNRTTLSAGNSFVTDSTLHDFARLSRAYRPAINLSGVGDQVLRNTIYQGPHSAIIFSGNQHLISQNEIYQVATETADAGAIYTGRDWSARGTAITDNFIHDIGSASLPQATAGIYLDDEASGMTISRNIFSFVNQAVFLGGGRDNTVDDNLFVNSSPAIYVDSRGLSWQKSIALDPNGIFQTELNAIHYSQAPYSTRYPSLATILSNSPGSPLGNLLNRNAVVNGTPLLIDAGAQPLVSVQNMFAEPNVEFSTSTPDGSRESIGDLRVSPSSPAVSQGFQASQFTR
jgi:hypothetical protein